MGGGGTGKENILMNLVHLHMSKFLQNEVEMGEGGIGQNNGIRESKQWNRCTLPTELDWLVASLGAHLPCHPSRAAMWFLVG